MKKYFLLFFSCLVFSCFAAQSQADSTNVNKVEKKKFTFFNELTSSKWGEGKVQLFQDARLADLITKKSTENKKSDNKDYLVVSGYRVQVYSSNTPRTAKEEAFKLDSDIKAKLPYVEAYISFTSPFWKVRVGDCRTYQEATSLLEVLKKEFPERMKEFYIVKDDIRISLN